MDLGNIIIPGIAGAVPAAVVILTLVEASKKLGLTGERLTILAFVLGVALGIGWRYAVAPMVSYADWFGAALYGLMLGASAIGANDWAGAQVSKGAKKD